MFETVMMSMVNESLTLRSLASFRQLFVSNAYVAMVGWPSFLLWRPLWPCFVFLVESSQTPRYLYFVAFDTQAHGPFGWFRSKKKQTNSILYNIEHGAQVKMRIPGMNWDTTVIRPYPHPPTLGWGPFNMHHTIRPHVWLLYVTTPAAGQRGRANFRHINQDPPQRWLYSCMKTHISPLFNAYDFTAPGFSLLH